MTSFEIRNWARLCPLLSGGAAGAGRDQCAAPVSRSANVTPTSFPTWSVAFQSP